MKEEIKSDASVQYRQIRFEKVFGYVGALIEENADWRDIVSVGIVASKRMSRLFEEERVLPDKMPRLIPDTVNSQYTSSFLILEAEAIAETL